jgi:lipoprotein-releasing system permease protein
MLGVATLIVVNSVMAGFTHEMHVRLKGILSDIIIEAHSMDGLVNPQQHIAEIREVLGDDLVGATAAVHVPAMLNIPFRGEWSTRQVTLIGVDETTYADVSDFRQYLIHPANREQISFLLREEGYGNQDHELPPCGWRYRRMKAAYDREFEAQRRLVQAAASAADSSEQRLSGVSIPHDPNAGIPTDPHAHAAGDETPVFDPTQDQYTGIVLGIAVGSVRHRDQKGKVADTFLCRPGDDVGVTFASAGTPPKAISDKFTIVDFYESKMSEYDSTFVFVPIKVLQSMRGIGTNVTSIEIKLKPGIDDEMVRDLLRSKFPPELYGIYTWRDKQGALLAAVQMERAVLNILLCLIIAVAGFGILAIFFMIVVEKTRDVGILKSLGASSHGIMGIFLGYGLSLGIVGAGVGLTAGLLFVHYINQVRDALEWVIGKPVFDPAIYYFYEIPTIIDLFTIVWIVMGAVLIAVLASVWPALRAARLHPVEALRYE